MALEFSSAILLLRHQLDILLTYTQS